MTKAKVGRNPKRIRAGANVNRPNGSNSMAESLDKFDLFEAAIKGNRATSRLARRNLRKMMRKDLRSGIEA